MNSLSKKLLVSMCVVLSLATGALAYLWISDEYRQFASERQSLWQGQFTERKEQIKHRVEHILEFIDFKHSQVESRVKKNMKDRVYEAHAIAGNLYEQYRETKSPEEIKELIRQALRPVRFNDGRGYYFAFSLSGVSEFIADRPELDGQQLIDMQDTEGAFVFRDMIALIKEKGEGFYSYRWSKPDAPGSSFKKISFVKHFAPLDWFFGVGEYLDDMEAEIQREILARVESIRFGKEGYAFIGRWDGFTLVGPGKGTNTWGVRDANGLMVVQKLVAAARQGGGFVEYVMPRFEGRRPLPKISYAAGVADWQWYVGSGVYLDDIEQATLRAKQDLHRRITRQVVKVVLLFFMILLIAFFLALRTSRQLRDTFASFFSFFNKAAQQSVEIDAKALPFKEFQELAESANRMVQDRLRIEGEVRKNEEKYRTLIETTDTGFVIVDQEGNVLDANQEYVRLTGYAALEDILGRRVIEWTAPYDQERNAEEVRNCFTTGFVRHLGIDYISPSGKITPIDINASLITTGEQVEILAIIRDMTERKRLEGQLRHAQKMEAIGTLAGGIAHDFNNILAAIFGYAEMAKRGLPEGHRARKDLAQVLQASGRAKELVQQILTFGRKAEQEQKPVLVQSLAKEALKLMRASMPSSITISQHIDPECGAILADPIQLHQVLVNLCTNAFHAMEDEGGELSVDLAMVDLDAMDLRHEEQMEPGQYVCLSVKDTGHGLAPEMRERIFEPYFSTKEMGKGFGMGLAVVHGIVKSHGGMIEVESFPGKGTVFQVFFPLAQARAREEEGEEEPELPRGNERILLVDDEPELVKMEKAMLVELGYTVTGTASSKEALALFQAEPQGFDLLLTDQTMPGLSGLELIEQVLALRNDLPVVLCTGYSAQVDEDAARKKGVSRFIMKPLTMLALAEVVRKALD